MIVESAVKILIPAAGAFVVGIVLAPLLKSFNELFPVG